MVAVVVLVGCVHSAQDSLSSLFCARSFPGLLLLLFVRKGVLLFLRLVKGRPFPSSGAAGFLVSAFVDWNISSLECLNLVFFFFLGR